MRGTYKALLASFVAATILGGGTAAYSQTRSSLWDPSQLPETRGTVKQYTLTPRGDVDGFILTDGTEVGLPPHLMGQIVFAVRPGDAVAVRGLKASALPLIDATSVTNLVSGATVVDSGPPGAPGRWGTEQIISGKVAITLHGKRGEINGALLEGGTTVRLPPPEAESVQALLQPGAVVAIRGMSLTTALGTVIDATAIGSTPEQLGEVAVPPQPRAPIGGPRGGGPVDFPPPPPRPPRG
jgi:hypothetical protein